ncbi:MAG: sensor histidine kinase [Chloroflexota bacterium]|nr:sensor histidine kinase [Chloroflexota bacterium]
MQSSTRFPRINLRHKLTLAHAAVTLAAILIAEGIALAALALIAHQPLFAQPNWGLNLALASAAAVLSGLLLGAWTSRRITRRLQHILDISNAWLRGNLSLRIADPVTDEMGLLAERLNLLAEHLEQDEQDLEELRERNERLTDQVRALAVVEERNRLARELHDSVKQHLFSLAMTAGGIRTRFDALPDVPHDLAEMVSEIETTAQAAQHEMTRLIKDLRPTSLQERGLTAALNDYTLLFGAREHILIYLEVQGNDALLSTSVAEALYRVAQEALHNVARHARATRADVHLRCIPEQVSLTIHDNGVGFDTAQTRQGLGLANMQERVMAAGGRLTIASQIGIGTTVLAEVGLTYPLGPQTEIARLGRNRPSPTIENWAWLGRKLVIPVGQTWPWLPADQMHLRRPLVEPGEEPLIVRRSAGFLGLKRDYVLRLGQHRTPLARIHRSRSGYEWESEDASWALRYISGLSGRMVLTRNKQPLAAMQYQGRLIHTWNEIVYDGRGYRLSYVKGHPDNYVLADEAGNELLAAEGRAPLQMQMNRALPLPLLAMVAMRIVDEMASASN